jgi:hydrogenase nickel incorporation protein HypA/HybF
MHELSIAQSILDIVREYVPEPRSAAVQSIKVRLGGLSGVVPESLDFCFSAITSDTSLRQAKLNIERVETQLHCGDCGETSTIEGPIFLCSKCGSPNIKLVSGTELQIVEIELAENDWETL